MREFTPQYPTEYTEAVEARVNRGTGGGLFSPGGATTVTPVPAPSGDVFVEWVGSGASPGGYPDVGFHEAAAPDIDVYCTVAYFSGLKGLLKKRGRESFK